MSRRRHWQGGQGRGGGARGEGVPCNSFHTGACNRLVAFSRASLSNSSSPGSDAEAESLVDMLLNEPSLGLNELSLPLPSSVESPRAGGGRGRVAINSCSRDLPNLRIQIASVRLQSALPIKSYGSCCSSLV